jgi:hypothetical protein
MHERHLSTICATAVVSVLWICTLDAAERQSTEVPRAPTGLTVSFPGEVPSESPLATTLGMISHELEVGARILTVYAGDRHRRESVVRLLTSGEKQVIEALTDVHEEALRRQLSQRMALGARRLNSSARHDDEYISKDSTQDALKQLLTDIERIRLLL